MDSRHLPASWSSTGNALEGIAFAAKDALLVIDDFAPSGTSADVARFHREADRILRAQGNCAGRQRMRADGELRPTKPPRSMILSTGEDVPKGQSLRARLLVLELAPGDLDFDRLTSCQKDAANGLFAQAMAAYVRYLAPRIGGVLKGLRAEVAELRLQAYQSGQHRRTPEIVASLALGLRHFLGFAQASGAMTSAEADALRDRCWKALGRAAAAQAGHQSAGDPVQRFIELLRGVITSGRAHVAATDGSAPHSPEAWGWREVHSGFGTSNLQPQGHKIGWVDGDDLYLEPQAAYASAQRMAGENADSLTVSLRTLNKRLHDRRLLASTDLSRGTQTIRRTLQGSRRSVLHLRAEDIMPREADQTDQSDHRDEDHGGDGQADGQFSGQFPDQDAAGTDRADCPTEAALSSDREPVGCLVSSSMGKDEQVCVDARAYDPIPAQGATTGEDDRRRVEWF